MMLECVFVFGGRASRSHHWMRVWWVAGGGYGMCHDTRYFVCAALSDLHMYVIAERRWLSMSATDGVAPALSNHHLALGPDGFFYVFGIATATMDGQCRGTESSYADGCVVIDAGFAYSFR